MAELSRRLLEIPDAMIYELALGVEEWKDIAERYGFTLEEWLQIENRRDLTQRVMSVRAENDKTGVTFRTRCRLRAEALLNETFKAAMQKDTPAKDKAQVLTVISRMAGVDTVPEAKNASSGGSGFSITINLPGAPAPAVTIDASPRSLGENDDVDKTDGGRLQLEDGTDGTALEE